MGNVVKQIEERIAKIDTSTDAGKKEAATLIREAREKLNQERHKLREQAHALTTLLRVYEPVPNASARRARGRGARWKLTTPDA